MPLNEESLIRFSEGLQSEQYLPGIGAKFVGSLLDGKASGFGRLYFDNGDYLEGDFVEGRCEGIGRYVTADGGQY